MNKRICLIVSALFIFLTLSSAWAEVTVTKTENKTAVEQSALILEKEALDKVFTISAETLKTYAWVNDGQVQGEIKAVAVDIQGLNNGHAYKTEPERQDTVQGEKGVLVVRPYSGPWNWMSFDTIAEIDDVLDAVYARYGLAEDIPLVVFGRSMGGIGVLNFARYARHQVTAVVANSPVTDLAYHATERPDCAATMYRAYSYYDCSVAEALEMHNPMRFLDQLPDVPYLVVAGTADTAVSKAHHSDLFVPAMRALGYDVTYVEVEGMAHCDLVSFPEVWDMYADYIAQFAE